MRFDDVIEEIGGFGRYQKLQYFLVCLFGFPAAFQTMVTVFIMDTPDHRCAVPGINDTYKRQNEAHTIAVDAAVPRDEDGAYSTCELYRNGNQTEECNRWVYSRDIYEETVISEFDIVCDNKILKTHANMALMGGLLGGSLIMGILSDLIGRKKTLLLSVVMNFGASLSASFMRNFWAFVALRILTTFSGIGMFMTSFVIGMELVGPQQRVIA
ncbi:organic cation transporter-like protein, partial [Aplysia californica]|uniref:Organic cation transporter-like protein n=1 Tax=Aplysia californica TaxID=6500 RepID=A0ABM1A7C5_APLCA